MSARDRTRGENADGLPAAGRAVIVGGGIAGRPVACRLASLGCPSAALGVG